MRQMLFAPLDMKVKNYLMHVNCINQEEISLLPPNFNNMQSLTADEIANILL